MSYSQGRGCSCCVPLLPGNRALLPSNTALLLANAAALLGINCGIVGKVSPNDSSVVILVDMLQTEFLVVDLKHKKIITG